MDNERQSGWSRRQALTFFAGLPFLADEAVRLLQPDPKRAEIESLINQGIVRREPPSSNLWEGVIDEGSQINFTDQAEYLPLWTFDNTQWILDNIGDTNFRASRPFFYPASVTKPDTIIVHHDSVCHNFEDDPPEKQAEYYKETVAWLKYYITSVHFVVSSVNSVQLLPMAKELVTRSFGAGGSYNIGSINIETTGCHNQGFPPEELTARTASLVLRLMKLYRIPFNRVLGHMERSHGRKPVDPGRPWLWHLRSKLYQEMKRDSDLLRNWQFYVPPNCKIADDLDHVWDCMPSSVESVYRHRQVHQLDEL